MAGDRLPVSQQRIVNHLLVHGWEQNGAANRLKKGNRRVCVGVTQTSFSINGSDGPSFFNNVNTKNFRRIKELA